VVLPFLPGPTLLPSKLSLEVASNNGNVLGGGGGQQTNDHHHQPYYNKNKIEERNLIFLFTKPFNTTSALERKSISA
jgi:hypothetical protein